VCVLSGSYFRWLQDLLVLLSGEDGGGITKQVDKMIQSDQSPQTILRWIEVFKRYIIYNLLFAKHSSFQENMDDDAAHDDEFCRGILHSILQHMTTVTGSLSNNNEEKTEKQRSIIQSYSFLLRKLLDEVPLQVVAVKAAQQFAHDTHAPKGLLVHSYVILQTIHFCMFRIVGSSVSVAVSISSDFT
jgi:hypothetical protein